MIYTSVKEQAYGFSLGYKEIAPNIWGMIAADAVADGIMNGANKLNSWMIPDRFIRLFILWHEIMDVQTNNVDKSEVLILISVLP